MFGKVKFGPNVFKVVENIKLRIVILKVGRYMFYKNIDVYIKPFFIIYYLEYKSCNIKKFVNLQFAN